MKYKTKKDLASRNFGNNGIKKLAAWRMNWQLRIFFENWKTASDAKKLNLENYIKLVRKVDM